MHVLHIGEVWNYLSPVHFGHNNFSDHRHQMIFKRLLSDQYHQNIIKIYLILASSDQNFYDYRSDVQHYVVGKSKYFHHHHQPHNMTCCQL